MNNENYAYEDSGNEWLGVLPTNWGYKRLKFLTECNNDILPESTDPNKEIRYIDISSVEYPKGIQNVEEMVFSDAPSRARRQVKNGDTIVSTVRPYLKAIAPIEEEDDRLVVSTGFAVIRPRYLAPKYLSRLLMSHYCVEAIASISVGVSYPAVNACDIGNIVSPEPPIEEQHAIASFLDRETARIDALIQKKVRMIDLLKEKRIALITHTVTKGLDPNVPMKDSGTEWLGEVPEHWGVLNFGRVSKSIKNGTTTDQESFSNEDYRVTRIESISTGFINLEKTGFVDYTPALDKYKLNKGDILFSHINSMEYVGNCAIYDLSETLYSGMNLLRIVPDSSINPKFLLHWLKSKSMKFEVQRNSKPAINQVSIPIGYVKSLPVLMPPIKEQQEIASHIDQETSKIDNLTSKITNSISLLREYRASLIHHAVTGKIDLRDHHE